MGKAIPCKTPVGQLNWVTITGEGKEDLQGNMKYVATVVVSKDDAKALQDEMMAHWAKERPKTVKEPKSTGWKPHMIKTDDIDPETGKHIFIPDEQERVEFQLKTNTVWPDGKPVVVPVRDRHGAKVNLGDKKIGNESIGRLIGSYDIYLVKTKSGTITDAGLTMYLSSVQLAKFVPYTGEAEVDEIEYDGDDGLDGLDVDETPIDGPNV